MSRIDLASLAARPAPETAAFNAQLAATLAGAPRSHEVPPETTRAARLAGQGVFPLGGPLEGSSWHAFPGAPGGPDGALRISRPSNAPRGVYLHIHGGGWTFGAPDQYDAANQALAEATGLLVASIRYRLAPENRWPACIDDCLAAALWVIENGPEDLAAGPLIIGGESAGAHLAALTILRLKALDLARCIAGAVLWYGPFDLAMTPSMRAAGERTLILSTPTVAWFVENLMGRRVVEADASISPLHADLSGFPDALLLAGTADPLLDDTVLMATRLAAQGGSVETAFFPGGIHAFDAFDLGISREARRAQAEWLARKMASHRASG